MITFDINKLLVPSPPIYDGTGDDRLKILLQEEIQMLVLFREFSIFS